MVHDIYIVINVVSLVFTDIDDNLFIGCQEAVAYGPYYLFNICTCEQGAVGVTETDTSLHNLIAYDNEIQVPIVQS